ncbi:MAG: SpoIIE family protein phosphatase [Candidatus Neomarinimicrobiota bacterium]
MEKHHKSTVKKPIVRRLVIWIGVPLFVVYFAVVVTNYVQSKNAAIERMNLYLIELTSHYASELNSQFLVISQTPTIVVEAIEAMKNPTEKALFDLMERRLTVNQNIFGMSIAFEPYAFSSQEKEYAPYVFRSKNGLEKVFLDHGYNYTTADWYLIPKLLKTTYWTEPYYDEGGGNTLMCTFSHPLHLKGKFAGIVTADISLTELEKTMRGTNIIAGYTFIVGRSGTFIYHPNADYVMRESIFSLAERFKMPDLRAVGKNMIHGKQGIAAYKDLQTGERNWTVYTPIPSCQWTFAAVIPEEKVLGPVNAQMYRQISYMLVGLVIILIVIVWASYGITIPLRKLAGFAEKISTGDLNVQIEGIKGEDEIHELASVFNKMVADLKRHIKDLTTATKAKEAVESELRIARQIQESLLPRVFPPFPDRTEFDLFAKNYAAKDVAGDFYDFFFIDENQLIIIIADVSGKGIPAALFMAVNRTLMKTVCQKGVGPAESLKKANTILSLDNDACMFTTLFLAVYDVKTGEMTFANAGHNSPFIISKDGSHRTLESFGDIFLGVTPDFTYREGHEHIDVGDLLTLYTDGVTEATSPEETLFGEERFIRNISSHMNQSLDLIWHELHDDLDKFQEGHQFDDITLMLLRRNT